MLAPLRDPSSVGQGSIVGGVIEKLRTSWRSYREKRRQNQIERALYKSGGRGPRYRDGKPVKSDDLSNIHGGGA